MVEPFSSFASVVQVISATPSFTAVTFPDASTVAISLFFESHTTFWLTSSPSTFAVSVTASPPTIISFSAGVTVSPVAIPFLESAVTVTVQVSLLVLSDCKVTVMVTVPTALAVTLPLSSTSTIEVSEETHVTFLLVALSGFTVMVSFPVLLPSFRIRFRSEALTESAFTS